MEGSRLVENRSTPYGDNLQSVIAFKAGPLVETYKSIASGNREFVYDVHQTLNGMNISIEILPWKNEPTAVSVVPHWINANVLLMPYSGFCFPLKSADPNESYQPDAGQDDHLFYQGAETRGIELLVFGPTKEAALDLAKKALLEPEIQELIKAVS